MMQPHFITHDKLPGILDWGAAGLLGVKKTLLHVKQRYYKFTMLGKLFRGSTLMY